MNIHKTYLIAAILFGFLIQTTWAQSSAQLPDYLITTYTGVLTSTNIRTKVNTNGSCTIKTRGYKTYVLQFSDGISSISGVKFMKNDDTYTATIIYKGKTLAVTVDEEGDLSIGSTSIGVLAFSGSTDSDRYGHDETAENTTISTRNTGIDINSNQTTIGTGDAGIYTNNGNISIGTGDNGISRRNGQTTVGNRNSSISTRPARSTKPTRPTRSRNTGNHRGGPNVCILHHNHNYGALIHCNSSEISELPTNAVGIYRGRLKTYDGVETRKGICTIVKTGCKVYRLDFSNGIPSIHDIQFGNASRFKEYVSVIVEGEYSSAIEVDMRFDDLEIDGEILNISFDGDKN